MKSVLILNGGRSGRDGNSAVIAARSMQLLEDRVSCHLHTLAERPSFRDVEGALRGADGLVIVSGTYWDSWSSVLQAFLEEATCSEATSLWLGKPCAIVITAHAVGGKGVLSRLQGVMNTFGAYVPPMAGMVYTAANQAALGSTSDRLVDDLWCLSDLEIVCHNLVEAVVGTQQWRSWTVDRTRLAERWISDRKTPQK